MGSRETDVNTRCKPGLCVYRSFDLIASCFCGCHGAFVMWAVSAKTHFMQRSGVKHSGADLRSLVFLSTELHAKTPESNKVLSLLEQPTRHWPHTAESLKTYLKGLKRAELLLGNKGHLSSH